VSELEIGTLVIIGGAEDKTTDKKILKDVFRLSGGKSSEISIITTATNYPVEVGNEYKKLFTDLGADKIHVINVKQRQDANDELALEPLSKSDCIFFVGGDQLRISSILGNTKVHEIIMQAYKNGKIIAGTSAGASMMSQIMVVKGEDDEAPRKCTLKMAPGMGLLNGVIIDQHFNQRGRLGRLLSAVAQNPIILGIGIDEDTAIVVKDGEKFNVIGSGVATVVDGRDILFTNVSEQHPDDPLAITNVKIHILPEGYGFNLKEKVAILLEETTIREDKK